MTVTSNDPDLMPPSNFKGYVPPPITDVPGPADIQNALAGWAQRKLAEQPWWRKSSNTVTAAIGTTATAAAALATYYGTQGTDVPQWLTIVIAVAGVLSTVLGVKQTRNGFTYQGAAQVQQAVLDPTVLETIQRTIAANPVPVHGVGQVADAAREWVEQNQVNRG